LPRRIILERQMTKSDPPTLDAFERDWQCALAGYDEHRRKYSAALDGSKVSKRKAARAYWGSVAVILHCYNRPGNWAGQSSLHGPEGWAAPRFAFPPALAKVLAEFAQYLSVGQMPEACTNVSGKGRSAPGPHELRDMAVAVAYVAALRCGQLVRINAPLKHVAERYGVRTRTLHKWIADMPWVKPTDFGSPAELAVQFAASAATYRSAGRSVSAIDERRSKRA
jgi:hypothetical protein